MRIIDIIIVTIAIIITVLLPKITIIEKSKNLEIFVIGIHFFLEIFLL